MIEIAAGLAVVAGTGGAIVAGVKLGTWYIDQKLSYHDIPVSRDQPLVRPSHPSGLDWLPAENP